MLILSACDIKYKPFMDCLVKSVLQNTPHKIRVDYLNPTGTEDERRDYCANYRIPMMEHCMWGQNLLWFDADTIVRGDISKIDKWLVEYDACAVFTPEMGGPGSMNRWLISTVGVSCSLKGQYFLDMWAKEFESIRQAMFPSIMTCQQAFVNVVERGGFNVKDIGYHYSDKDMKPESPVWEGQGPRKHEGPAWLEEMKKYS
jgi:hypothetical protein